MIHLCKRLRKHLSLNKILDIINENKKAIIKSKNKLKIIEKLEMMLIKKLDKDEKTNISTKKK